MELVNRIITLITCILIVMVAATRRGGKVLGHNLSNSKDSTTKQTSYLHKTSESQDVADELGILTTLPDGTIVINTTELGGDIFGFAGNVPIEIFLKEGKIDHVEALDNFETPAFFEQAAVLLKVWDGCTIEEAMLKEVDAVSGATFSSCAIIDNLHAGLQYVGSTVEVGRRRAIKAKSVAGLIVVLCAAIIPLFGEGRRLRRIRLILNVLVLGLWCGTFLSWSLFVSYMANGVGNIWVSLIPIIMLITAFIYPLFGKKNFYCTNICPLGSFQELAGQVRRKKLKISAKTIKRLNIFRQILFAVLLLLMLTGVWFAWMDYELFMGFILQSANVVVIILAVLFVVLSVFTPRPYCNYLCPTGSFLKLL